MLKLTHALIRYGTMNQPVKRRVRAIVVPALGSSPVIWSGRTAMWRPGRPGSMGPATGYLRDLFREPARLLSARPRSSLIIRVSICRL